MNVLINLLMSHGMFVANKPTFVNGVGSRFRNEGREASSGRNCGPHGYLQSGSFTWTVIPVSPLRGTRFISNIN